MKRGHRRGKRRSRQIDAVALAEVRWEGADGPGDSLRSSHRYKSCHNGALEVVVFIFRLFLLPFVHVTFSLLGEGTSSLTMRPKQHGTAVGNITPHPPSRHARTPLPKAAVS